jgi:hypothetical protein
MIMKDEHTQSEGACLLAYAVHDLCVFLVFFTFVLCVYICAHSLGFGLDPSLPND